MILDAQTLLSDNQALSGTGALLSTNTLDFGAPGAMALNGNPVPRDVGKGGPMALQVQVTGTATGGTSVAVEYVHADDAALSTNVAVLATSPAIPLASLVAGYVFPLGHVPFGATKRYHGMRYQRVGTFTGGTVTAAIILDRQPY